MGAAFHLSVNASFSAANRDHLLRSSLEMQTTHAPVNHETHQPFVPQALKCGG
jgi:hypothetical protein